MQKHPTSCRTSDPSVASSPGQTENARKRALPKPSRTRRLAASGQIDLAQLHIRLIQVPLGDHTTIQIFRVVDRARFHDHQ